jgi:hypothetical protein
MDYNDVLFDIILKVPILFICGDSEGQYKLVGRQMIYSSGSGTFTGHICRYCDVPYDKTDKAVQIYVIKRAEIVICTIGT